MAANENALTRPIFELGLCSLHTNWVEFHQKEIGTSYSKAICQWTPQSAIGNQTLALQVDEENDTKAKSARFKLK